MEPQTQPTAEKVASKRCNHLPLIIILIVIALGSLGFAGYEFLQIGKKNDEIKDLKANSKTTEPDKKDSSGTPISTAEADEILQKYIGETGLKAIQLDPKHRVFTTDYNDELKLELAVQSLSYDELHSAEGCKDGETRYTQYNWCSGAISFDVLNKAYEKYYGDYATLEKENLHFGNIMGEDGKTYYHTYLDYNAKTDAFDVYVSGIGGTAPVDVVRKVVSVREEDGAMIATVIYGEYDYSYAQEDRQKTEEYLENSYRLYEFTLSPYNDTYVLTKVQRIDE